MTNKQKALDTTITLLRRSTHGITTRELADELGCNPSTAYRYIQELQNDGYSILEEERGHYRLELTNSPYHLSLRPKEAVIIYLALRRYIRQTSRAPHFMISALNRIADALQRPDLVSMLRDSVHYLEQERTMPNNHNVVWETLIEAWLKGQVVEIDYQKARQNDLDTHIIEPYLFEPAILSDGTYLIAHSQTRNDLRTFKTDRIHAARLLSAHYQKPPSLSPMDLLRHSWGIWYGQEDILQTFELRFPAHVANRVMEQVFHPNEKKQVLTDGSVMWTARLAGELEILSWVRSWGPDVQVIAPEGFKQTIINDLRRALNIYLDNE
ncbi:MAG: transcriptional regulator [Phototrophicales bacterium]|nr:transcriptional regulator [Phototrophicales bacterium]